MFQPQLTAAAVLLAVLAGTDAFAVAPAGLRLRDGSRPVWRRALKPLCAGPRMQVRQWVETAATDQGRDPVRLMPLKPLPDVIRIRTLVRPDFKGGEMAYADGLLGIGQKMNAGKSPRPAVAPATSACTHALPHVVPRGGSWRRDLRLQCMPVWRQVTGAPTCKRSKSSAARWAVMGIRRYSR